MSGDLTILWTELATGDVAMLERVAEEHGAALLRVGAESLAAHTFAALVLGPVVVVVPTAKDASRALGMGADEVVRIDGLSKSTFEETIARARARAGGRVALLAQHAAQESDEVALTMMLGAFAQELGTPLAASSMDLEMLLSSMPSLLDLADGLTACATRGESTEARRLATRRLALPPTSELKKLLTSAREAVRRAEQTSSTLRAIGGTLGGAKAASLIRRLMDLLRPSLAPWADVSVGASGTCAVDASPILVTLIVTTLLTSAADSIRAARRERGRIEVRVAEREGAVVIEVQDDGLEIPADLRPSLRQSYFGAAPSRLTRAREHVVRSGGDLMIDSDPSGTIVRVLLPAADEAVSLDPATTARHPTRH